MKPRAIYMDVGCWQSLENEEPTMTFGLMQHNALALCTFYSNGRRLCRIPYTDRSIKYDFRKSLINEFLEMLMVKKYGQSFELYLNHSQSPYPEWAEYHIINFIPFPSKSLLDDESMLIVFIPDLHLHYFKDTHLDNFITYYENEWSSNLFKPICKRLENRKSMENEFSQFLKTIFEFQQKKGIYSSRVVFLGDMYEMWETNALLYCHCVSGLDIKELYNGLQEIINWLHNNYVGGNIKIKEFLRKLKQMKIGEIPLDQRLVAIIATLQENKDLVKRIFVYVDDLSKEELTEKANNLASEILKKYHDQQGESYVDLLDKIKWRIMYSGNHDNFLHIPNMDPLNTFHLGDYEPSLWRFDPNYDSKKSDFFFGHGHNFDAHNNDEACATGALITSLLTFFEAKKRGNILKKYEDVFRKGDVRLDYKQKICRVFNYWEHEYRESKNKNKIIILAHTHQPYLEDISNEYLLWSGISKKMKEYKEKILKKPWLEELEE